MFALSQISHKRAELKDALKVGQEVTVKFLANAAAGRVSLSIKAPACPLTATKKKNVNLAHVVKKNVTSSFHKLVTWADLFGDNF